MRIKVKYMYIHVILPNEVRREIHVRICVLFVYSQNYFEDFTILVDVCKKQTKN